MKGRKGQIAKVSNSLLVPPSFLRQVPSLPVIKPKAKASDTKSTEARKTIRRLPIINGLPCDVEKASSMNKLKPLIEVISQIKEIERYLHSSSNVNNDTKKSVLLSSWDQLIQMFMKYDMKTSMIQAMKKKGDFCFLFHQIDQALFEYRKAKRYAKTHGFSVIQSELYKCIAKCYHYLRRYEESMVYYKKQLQFSWDLGLKAQELDSYDSIGLEYYLMGDLAKAKKYHVRAMNGTVESEKSPAKKTSVLSLWRKRDVLEDWFNKHCTMLRKKDKEDCLNIKRLITIDKSEKQVTYKPLEEILNKKTRWRMEELPTARVSQRRPFHYHSEPKFLPNLKQSLSNKGIKMQLPAKIPFKRKQNPSPLYSHLSLIRISDYESKADAFEKILKKVISFRHQIYNNFNNNAAINA